MKGLEGLAGKAEIHSEEVGGEPGTGFEKRGTKGVEECGNCKYFETPNACDQSDMKSKSKQPRLEDGRVKVGPRDCCAYVKRVQ
jgi:hypothetical protein